MAVKKKIYSVVKVEMSDQGEESVFVNTAIWLDPAAWGNVLSDIAKSARDAFKDKYPRGEFLETVIKEFNRTVYMDC